MSAFLATGKHMHPKINRNNKISTTGTIFLILFLTDKEIRLFFLINFSIDFSNFSEKFHFVSFSLFSVKQSSFSASINAFANYSLLFFILQLHLLFK